MQNTSEKVNAESILKEYDLNNTYAAQKGYSCEGFHRWVGWTPKYTGEIPTKLDASFDTSILSEQSKILRTACLVHLGDCLDCQGWIKTRKDYVEFLAEITDKNS